MHPRWLIAPMLGVGVAALAALAPRAPVVDRVEVVEGVEGVDRGGPPVAHAEGRPPAGPVRAPPTEAPPAPADPIAGWDERISTEAADAEWQTRTDERIRGVFADVSGVTFTAPACGASVCRITFELAGTEVHDAFDGRVGRLVWPGGEGFVNEADEDDTVIEVYLTPAGHRLPR